MPAHPGTDLLRELDQLSLRYHHRAAQLADRQLAVRAAAAGLQWESPAARALARSLSGLLDLGSRCQHRCTELADALTEHRRRVEHRLHVIEAAERAATRAVLGWWP